MASLSGSKTNQATTPQIVTMPAKSSWIDAFEYDQQNLRLTVHLKNGSKYQYIFYLPVAWNQLQTSQDHSEHFSRNIRGKYGSVRIRNANKGKKPNKVIKEKK